MGFFVPLVKNNAEAYKALMEQPSNKTISQDQVRESLIAISYTSPDEEESVTSLDVKPATDNIKGNTDAAEKLRSELISISYDDSPSPDMDVPVSPQLPNGISRG